MTIRICSATLLLLVFGSFFSVSGQPRKNDAAAWQTPFELSKGTQTTTYPECIGYYKKLASAYPQIGISEAGPTDCGLPLHVVVISKDGKTTPEPALTRSKRVLFIQNGIHPGEPDGIDASMMLARNLVQNKKLQPLLDRLTVVIIPIYNVDGALNRNSNTRANQNGPASYGFRGNAKNLDLNRDYIKLDSRNAQSLVQVFQAWQPDVFVDTHTSNGADYQHVMTLVATQPDKLQRDLGVYLRQLLSPALYSGMSRKKFDMTPYVDPMQETPDKGIVGFLDHPRYSTGYAALFNTIGFMTETHMLKPFGQRVQATYAFLEVMLQTMHEQHQELAEARRKAIGETTSATPFYRLPLNYKIDTTQIETITFKGYQHGHKKSEVSGLDRLYYDRKKPWTKQISYYNAYVPGDYRSIPDAYIIPQAWHEVVERLQLNGVKVNRLTQDSEIQLWGYVIEQFETSKTPYEGHYLHSQVKVREVLHDAHLRKGDYLVLLAQPAKRFLMETLEPSAVDSYFCWNFFDSILQQKEWFSDYVYEDVAADLLKKDLNLQMMLNKKKAEDTAFAKNAWAQLYFVYTNSGQIEKSLKRYPVLRVASSTLERLTAEEIIKYEQVK